MSSVNSVTILGRLGQDPEVRTFPNGGKVCNLSVATSEKWRDKNSGETKERTEWHRVAIFADGLVGIAEKYLSKGDQVYLEGQLETRKWQDQSGADRYSTEITLRPFNGKLVLIGGGNSQSGQRDSGQGQQGGSTGYSAPPTGGAPDMDDEIPFKPMVL